MLCDENHFLTVNKKGFADLLCFVEFCRHDFNIAVLKAFVSLSDFAGMILVQALRLVCILCSRIYGVQSFF